MARNRSHDIEVEDLNREQEGEEQKQESGSRLITTSRLNTLRKRKARAIWRRTCSRTSQVVWITWRRRTRPSAKTAIAAQAATVVHRQKRMRTQTGNELTASGKLLMLKQTVISS